MTAPVLRAGMEGDALMVVVLIDLVLIVMAHPVTIAASVVLTVVALGGGRALARVDPQMTEVYLRHLRRELAADQSFTPAQGEPGAPEPTAVRALRRLR